MRGSDKPYQDWEKRPSFETKDGRRVYPLYAPAYQNQPNHAWAFDTEVDPLDPDLEYSLTARHRVGLLDWDRDRVIYVETGRTRPKMGEPSWERQGIATELLRLAREMHPDLLHAHCRNRVSEAGEAFVRATSPDEHARTIAGKSVDSVA